MSGRLAVVDAATETLHLGVCDGESEWTCALPGGAQASAGLLPALFALLREAGLELKQLDAIGFGRGPGAFTGVRTACAVAQGLAFGAARPVLALDTLMAVAEDARDQGAGPDVWVAVDARMGEAYAAHYRHEDGAWQTLEAPALHAPDALALRAGGGASQPEVAGNSLDAHRGHWATLSAPRWPLAVPRAHALLALARAAWARGEALDVAEALPLYVRDRVAQTTAERSAQAAARS
jgi:tRNA threonylcarbamoyladenosine biosynthesis protein TsaB